MDKLLFIALEFAPINTTGNFRSLKFVKYLRNFGVEPIVLTLDVESGKKTFNNRYDEKLLLEIPENTKIERVSRPFSNDWMFKNKITNFLRIYFKTDDKITHDARRTLFSKLDEIIKTEKPKALYITLPPFSGYVLVNHVKKNYDLRIIVDMRDAWSHWTSSPWQTRLHFERVFKRERQLFQRADKILTVTKELGDIFKHSHPEATKDKIHIISNGYDSDLDFEQPILVSTLSTKEQIKIGYIGSFYYNPVSHTEKNKKWWKRFNRKKLYYSHVKEDWSYRSPLYFLNALSKLVIDYPELRSRIVFEHIGRTPEWLYTMLKELDLEDNFKAHGFVPYHRVLELQEEFDFLLATSEKVIGGDHYCLPSKLFDYLRASKPILGFMTEGSQKIFLQNSGIAVIFDPDDVAESANKLKQLFEKGENLQMNRTFIEDYQRLRLTKEFASVIKGM